MKDVKEVHSESITRNRPMNPQQPKVLETGSQKSPVENGKKQLNNLKLLENAYAFSIEYCETTTMFSISTRI